MPTNDQPNRCPNCERVLPGDPNFCPYCGHDTRRQRPSPPPPPEERAAREESPPTPKATPVTRAKVQSTRRRLRFFDRHTLVGILGLVELPIIALLLFLLLRPFAAESPPDLACDDIDPESFAVSRFASGLGGEMEEDTLFTAGTTYLFNDVLVVPQNRRLLIQPGARLEFEAETGLDVQGSLYVCGSAEQPVTFTSPEGEPGSWRGIHFLDAADDNVISHALIQFGGDRAVYLEESAPDFHDVTISASSAFPVSSDGNRLPETMVDVTFENNPFDGIEIRGGEKADVQNILWPNHDIVYVVSGFVVTGENTALEIEPGTVVKFWPASGRDGAGLRVRGLLKAEEVHFTSVYDSGEDVGASTYVEARDPQPGDWGGIIFDGASQSSFLRTVSVRFAGREQGAIAMRNSSPQLEAVTVADSAWYPLSVDADSFPSLEEISLVDNEPGDAVEVRGDSAISGRAEHVWQVLGDASQIVRVVRGTVLVEQEATLVIEPGVVVKFEPGARLVVRGTLVAEGNADEGERIVFTSLRDDEYGGRTDKNTGPQDERAWDGIIFDGVDDSSLLRNSLVRFAPVVVNNATPRLVENQIVDSETAAIWMTPNSAPTIEVIEVRDNEMNGVAVYEGEVTADQIWDVIATKDGQLARILTGQVTVAENATLVVRPGVVVKADADGHLRIRGDLDVEGEEERPVIFTSLHDDAAGGDTSAQLRSAEAGDWSGLVAGADADLSFAYTTIRFAQTALSLNGEVIPEIAGWLRATDNVAALWCDARLTIPDNFIAEGNDDNFRRCPTE